MKARDFIPALKYGAKIYPEDTAGILSMNDTNGYWFVDGDKSGDGGGKSWEDAYNDIQSAVTAASAGDTIFVAGRTITDLATDPVSYAETIIIPNNKPQLSLIGVSRGRTQGGLPQIKPATTTSALLTVRAPGVLIANLGFNGANSTGGGVVLDDDGGISKVAFGASIVDCHFKNCVGTTATDARTGAAIKLAGAPWQILIKGNRFYKNVGDILSVSTYSDFQDVVIEDNIFSGQAANTDCNIYTVAGGAGNLGLIIRNNVFQQLPAIGSGSVKRFIYATGCTGMLIENYFGVETCVGGTEITFKVAGTGAEIPATMHMAGNFGEFITGTGAGLESGEIARV